MPETCKFCGESSALVKSHIIPEGLYWGLQDQDTHAPVIASPHPGEYQARRPNGIWGRFLCADHEQQFNAWDTHAVAVLRDSYPSQLDDGWLYEDFCYDKLKLFFLSLLWRAHSTSDSFFDRVDLGAHADRIKAMIKSQHPGAACDYAVVLWRSDELMAKAVIAPFPERYDGVRFMRLYLPGYMALIKVDQRTMPGAFYGRELPVSGGWFVPRREFAGGSEERAMLATVKKNLEKQNAKRS